MTPAGHRDRFRAVIGHFATGVAVVTAQGEDGPAGMTANAVASLSLDPLLVLVCFDNAARTLPVVRRTRRFGVSVLAAGQEELSKTFASKLPEREKFAGAPYTVRHEVPILDGALAWLACDLEELMPGGDHTIATASVLDMHHEEGDPLLFYRGSYETLGLSRS